MKEKETLVCFCWMKEWMNEWFVIAASSIKKWIKINFFNYGINGYRFWRQRLTQSFILFLHSLINCCLSLSEGGSHNRAAQELLRWIEWEKKIKEIAALLLLFCWVMGSAPLRSWTSLRQLIQQLSPLRHLCFDLLNKKETSAASRERESKLIKR